MKYLQHYFPLIIIFLLLVHPARAQIQPGTAFNAKAYLDINHIKAAHLVHGDMFWDPSASEARCEFPKGSGKNASFVTALWMGGYDGSNNLHVAAQTYRQDGNDYWPGPIENVQPVPYDSAASWAKIWKVNRADITGFLAVTNHTGSNTPAGILSWPAKGNPYAYGSGPLHISRDMAPFVDVNNDGIYNALQGDYPEIKGDQMLWWVINDNGAAHSQTNSMPLGAEIMVMAYAYNRGSAVDNILFYEYYVTNRSANNYSDFRFGLFSDTDLGYAFDDYIGFDSSHRMAITYNGKVYDGQGETNSYGARPPMTGFTILETPGDAGGTYEPAGNFAYHNNDFTVIGNPSNDTQFYGYLSGYNKGGIHFSNDWDYIPGHNSKAYNTSNYVNYVYPGIHSDSSQWSECVCNNKPDDRRYILSAAPRIFNAGSTLKFALAFVVTDTGAGHTCPSTDFSDVKNMADTAWYWYHNVPPSTGIVQAQVEKNTLKLYPNPAQQSIFIETTAVNDHSTVTVYDALGKMHQLPSAAKNNTIELDIQSLAPGVYTILYRNGVVQQSGVFIKE